MPSTQSDIRSDLAEEYRRVRSTTEWLAEPLGAEDQTVQSMPDVSPTKWHRAHTTWFFETFVLGHHQPGYRVYDSGFDYLFNSYYEAVGPRHPRAQRGLISRPGVGEVTAYRQVVDDAMVALLDGGVSDEVAALVELPAQHFGPQAIGLPRTLHHHLVIGCLSPQNQGDANHAVVAGHRHLGGRAVFGGGDQGEDTGGGKVRKRKGVTRLIQHAACRQRDEFQVVRQPGQLIGGQ